MDSFLDFTPAWPDFQFVMSPTNELLDVTNIPWELLWPSPESPASALQPSISTPPTSPSLIVPNQEPDPHSKEIVRRVASQRRGEYRRKQNRISQRNYRERQKRRIEELEKQVESLRAYCKELETQNRMLSQDHNDTWDIFSTDVKRELEGEEEASRQESINWMLRHAYKIPKATEDGL